MPITYIDIILKVLTFLTVAVAAFLAVRRFGLQRESATFLRVLVTTKELAKSGSLILTTVGNPKPSYQGQYCALLPFRFESDSLKWSLLRSPKQQKHGGLVRSAFNPPTSCRTSWANI